MQQPFYTIANRRFTNLESATIHVARFRFPPVQHLLDSVTSVFRTLDFSDEYQAELGWNIWRLRCSVLFGLVPYNHEGLQLLVQGEQISAMADRLPGSRDSAGQLADRLVELLDQPENPKLEWLRRQDWGDENPAAIFALMAMRKSFGTDLIDQLPDPPINSYQVISSLDQTGSGEYPSLVIPGTCQYLSHSLFMKLFHLGEYCRIHVLLYDGEAFRPRDRLRLPGSPLLPQASERKELHIKRSDVIDPTEDEHSDVDRLISEGLFRPPGGVITDDGRGIPSRFVLCDDGKGFQVAENDRIRVWRARGPEWVMSVFPAQLSEGDFVIIEKSDRGELLDQSENRQEFEAELEATKAWREPLQALLLSRSLEEVAILMSGTGHIPELTASMAALQNAVVSDRNSFIEGGGETSRAIRNLKSTISNWAEERVHGPGDEQHMLALVQVLLDEGRLDLDRSPEEATRQWFKDLEKLRAGQRAAGMHVRKEIDKLLEESLGELASLTDGQEVKLENGMVVSLHQLAMIGDQVSRVPESSLGKPI